MNIYPSYVEDALGEWLRYKVWSDFDRLNDGLWHNPFTTQADFPKAREYLIDWGYKQDTEIKFFYPVLHSTSNYLKSISHYNSKNKLKYNVAVGNTFEIIADTTAPPQPFHIFSNKRYKFIYDKYRQLAIQSDLKLFHTFYFLLNIIRPINPTDFSYNVKFLSDLHLDRNLTLTLYHAPYFTVDLENIPSSEFRAYINLKPSLASNINVEEVLNANLSQSVSFEFYIAGAHNTYTYDLDVKTQHSLASNINVEEVLNANLSQNVSFAIDLVKSTATKPSNVYEYSVEIKTSHTIASDLTVCPSSNVWYVKDNWQEFTNGWSTTCS
jgi:hypothetical protein